jgi:putative ABC transport system permease protein
LFVAGVGIMNIMLVSVTERTREIGICKSLGAERADILLQFLTEAVLLAGIGGTIGITLGFILSKVVSSLSPLPTLVRPSLIIAALVVATLTGVLAGFFPARRASKLPPVEALRWE